MDKENVELIFSGDEYFHRALSDIRNAQIEVCVESYIFSLDFIGNEFLQALCDAHKRGVKVRLLVDGIGSLSWIPTIRRRSQTVGFSFRVYHPLPSYTLFLIDPLRLWTLFRKLNRRNHRKLILIDHNVVYLGSFNIAQVHSERYSGNKAWRDTGVRLDFSQKNPYQMEILRQAFQHVWLRAKYLFSLSLRRREPLISLRFRLNSTALARMKLLKDLRQKLRNSEKRILITNAYFIPRWRLMAELRRAAKRGVYVALCLPAKTDVWFVREASWSLYHRLIKSGIHIFEYQPTVLHAKTMIVDDWATVGSHNLNHRSLMHDLEVETVITESDLIQQLLDKWDNDIKHSKNITQKELGKRSLVRQLFSTVFWWFRYWI